MQRCFAFFCVSLIFCATISETIGLVVAAKEKRGWTLNSAGYLLGPRRIDHLIQIKDSPSARGRDELVTQFFQLHRNSMSQALQVVCTIYETEEIIDKPECLNNVIDLFFGEKVYGIDGHRTLGDKAGLAGKRDMGQEEDIRTGALRIGDGDIIHTVIDFLSYLKLKEMGVLDSLPSAVTSDELDNP